MKRLVLLPIIAVDAISASASSRAQQRGLLTPPTPKLSIQKWYSFRDFCSTRSYRGDHGEQLAYFCPGQSYVDSEYINDAWPGILISSSAEQYRLHLARTLGYQGDSFSRASSGWLRPDGDRGFSEEEIEIRFGYYLFGGEPLVATTDAFVANIEGLYADFKVLAFDEVGTQIYEEQFLLPVHPIDYAFVFVETVTINAPRIASVKILPDPNCQLRKCDLDPGRPCNAWGNCGIGLRPRGDVIGIGTLTPIDASDLKLPTPISSPTEDDHTFLSVAGGGLDTKCTYRSDGPLIISIKVPRVIGDRTKLLANGLLPEMATLRLSTFSIDTGSLFPEFDQVSFNGNTVEGGFLSSEHGKWKVSSFLIPFEWIRFPDDPGEDKVASPEYNVISVDIDTQNTGQWCTAIDWVSLTIDEIILPIVMVHGFLSSGNMWEPFWEPKLEDLGVPNDGNLSMGLADTIQSNAEKIEAKISASKRRWGVNQVVLVSHSKGGIDSRHYIEQAKDVTQLVQLGTPNWGSPLADFIQGGYIAALFALGPLAVAIGNIFQYYVAPGGAQLTTSHMLFYNLAHSHNPNVQYTSVAGIYDPGCPTLLPCHDHIKAEDWVTRLIVGVGDNIVPLHSALALGLGFNVRTHATSGSNIGGTHNGLDETEDVFTTLHGDLVNPRYLEQTNGSVEYAVLNSKAGTLSEGQTSVSSFVIDEIVPEAFVLIFYPSGNLDFQLSSPSGVLDQQGIFYDAETSYGGRMASYGITEPERGTWSLSITGVEIDESSGETPYLIMTTLMEPTITLKTALVKSSVPHGEPLTFTGTLIDNGSPVWGATVSAFIEKPDGSVDFIVLRDDGAGPDLTEGDGVYTGSLTATEQPGTYRSLIMAEDSEGSHFSREGFVLGVVSRSASAFSGEFSDVGLDENSDGYFDHLAIEVGVNADGEGVLRIFGELVDSAGNKQSTSFEIDLSAGPNLARLRFDGRKIFENKVNGPYILSHLRLAEEEGISIAILDDREDAYSTSAYDFHQFQPRGEVTSTTTSTTGAITDGSTAGSTTKTGDIGTTTDGVSTTASTSSSSLTTTEVPASASSTTSMATSTATTGSTGGSTTKATTDAWITSTASTTTSGLITTTTAAGAGSTSTASAKSHKRRSKSRKGKKKERTANETKAVEGHSSLRGQSDSIWV